MFAVSTTCFRRTALALCLAGFPTAVASPSFAGPIEPLPAAPAPEPPPAPADVAEAPPQAERSASGLAWRVLRKGKGDHPAPYDRVTVHYTGWTPDGHVFDSSIPNEEPTSMSLTDVIAGWREGVCLMSKGEKRRFWIPAELAYGSRPTRPGTPAGPLVFDVELIDFVKMPAPIPVPEDVGGPPPDAKRTASGLSYKILRHGTGKQHPTARSTVEVHYSGWTTEGDLFDSSVRRGAPARFGLDAVIKGWTEGLQLLVVGDKARFWIPGRLAYGDKPSQPGNPAGMLVFDVELLAIR